MPITALKIEGKETYPMFVFAKCCLSVHPPQIGGAWQACTQQTKKNHSHTTSGVSCQVYVLALLVKHL